MVTIAFVVARSAVARELGEPQHRVDQILNTRQHIRPLRRVGIVRAHALEAGDLVQAGLEHINWRRAKVPRTLR